MKIHDQFIAIGEAAGWTKIRMTVKGSGAPERRPSPHGFPPGKNYEAALSYYSLDQVHHAEQVILLDPFSTTENDTMNGSERITKQLRAFEKHLKELTLGLGSMWHATAAHRREALIRALGKWTDA